ncbi:hypothetical protein LV457_13645 [Mycobacterium sp. MYCO198283]|uniref:hypothetical protein n=1 Tax=Mycobacterium sp. MYCO198283 TaxID=2883505 RepID=UPI001E509192|nr:hypothetical protein [Mycobacterium sp. MYCO198283]MCG5433321.1 hypothetical protein [Mycobacterium sp. MYCO198283]
MTPPDRIDRALLDAANALLRRRRRPGLHSVAAAVRTAGGNTYVALDVRSRKSPVCAEPCAVSAAHSAGDYDIERIAAVVLAGDDGQPAVIAPCGACRELLHFHAPRAEVLVQDGAQLARVPIAELFRYPDIPSQPYELGE